MSKESAVTFDRTQMQGAREEASDEPMHILGDEVSGTLRVSLWTWDSGATAWVRQPLMDMAALTTAIDGLTAAVDALTAAIEAM